MRKRIVRPTAQSPRAEESEWLNLEDLATVEISSEDPAHPIERALELEPADFDGWRAGEAGVQVIRLVFDQPQIVRRVELLFSEPAIQREQEFTLSWSTGADQPRREIVRQQYHFSPGGSTQELEGYEVDLDGLRILELTLNPDRNGGPAHATLARLRVA
jgi:hypothetical protein